MKFLPYQLAWINDKSRMKILEKSRRIGGTYSTSYATFRELMDRPGHDIVVVTRDENLATEFVSDVSRWLLMWNALNPDCVIQRKHFKRLSLEIPHSRGMSRLIAVSSNPNAAIGRGGSLVLDEFAAHKDPDLLMRLAQPIIMAGGNLSVLSTHRSRNSRFNEIVINSHEEGSQWSRHKTTIVDAIEQGLVEQIVNPNMVKLGNEPWETREAFLNWLKSTYDEFTFQQEFMCVPSDDASSLLTFDEVNGAIKKYDNEGSLKTGVYFVGYDIAESLNGDFATYCVIRADHEHNVEIVEAKYFDRGTSINDQIDEVVRVVKQYNARRLVPDAGGIGRHPSTILEERLGNHVVVPFQPTLQTKAEAYPKAKRYFQNGWIRMRDDKHVKDDFLSIDRVITPSNNIVYQAIRSGNIGHGDMFSAFAMALTEVDEHTRSEIMGVSAKKSDPMDSLVVGHTIHDRIERNRRKDKKDKGTLTY